MSGGGWWQDSGKRHLAVSVAGTRSSTGAVETTGQLMWDGKDGTVVRSLDVDTLVVDGGRATVRGRARVGDRDGYRYELVVTDAGTDDTARLVVTRPGDPGYRLESAGTLGGGNIVVRAR